MAGWDAGGDENSAAALWKRVEGALRWEDSQDRAEGRSIVVRRVIVSDVVVIVGAKQR